MCFLANMASMFRFEIWTKYCLKLVMCCLKCGSREPKFEKWVYNLLLLLTRLKVISLELKILKHVGWSWLAQELRAKYPYLADLLKATALIYQKKNSDWVSLLLWTESWIRSNIWLWEDKGDEKESFNPKRHRSHLRKTKLVRNLKNDVYYNANYNLSGRVGVIFNTIFIKETILIKDFYQVK